MDILYKFLTSFRYKSIKAKKDYISSRNIYVVGYPISGNSWIAYLITYIMNCKYFDIDSLEWSDQRKGLKKYLNGSNKHIGSNIFDNVYKTHSKISLLPNKSNDIIIYVIRDIRDVCNSYFHRFEKIYAISNSEVSFIRRFIYFVYKNIIPYKFRYNFLIRFFAHEWSNHKKELYENEKIILVLYEDMIDNPLGTLDRIINKIDPLAWDKIEDDAIEKFSLNNMKKVATKSGGNILKTDRVEKLWRLKIIFGKKILNFLKKNIKMI